MTRPRKTDMAASVRQRLLNLAKKTGRPFQEVLQYFAMERFLYRLSRSKEPGRFVLKGALMLTVWRSPATRPTKDIDLLARMSNEIEGVVAAIKAACATEVEDDGLRFDANQVTGRTIREDADYEGVRVTFQAKLGRARVPMQIDLGFGDVMTPAPELTEFPTLLEFSAPVLYAYSRETTIAEKFEAMVKLGELNSRMKDFFDIWLLSRQFTFDGETLRSAIDRTFAHRGSAIVVDAVALSDGFAALPGKEQQWKAFVDRSRITGAPASLAEVVQDLRSFLRPVVEAAAGGLPFTAKWKQQGGWSR
jgi:Nucleotidyl transferase AbiEii toxin, Type IV TA system